MAVMTIDSTLAIKTPSTDLIGTTSVEAEVGDGPTYWWLTSGQDLSRMLVEADYPEECRRQFLDFYRGTICPLLGGKPEPWSRPAAVGWDGNPFEYSFEFKGSTKKAGVRFVLDLSELRPARTDRPLDVTTVERALDVLRQKSPLYDETWVCFDHLTPYHFPRHLSLSNTRMLNLTRNSTVHLSDGSSMQTHPRKSRETWFAGLASRHPPS